MKEDLQLEDQYRRFLDLAPDAMVIVAADGLISIVNEETERLFGYKREELVGQPVEILIPDSLRKRHTGYRKGYAKAPERRRMGASKRLLGRKKDRSEFPVEISLAAVRTDGELLICATVRDVTEQQDLERQLIGAQRMEAVGRLAGGVAHDFNNLLTAILSFSGFVLDDLRPEDPAHADLQEVIAAATRAESLTRQLLTFSRRRPVEPVTINLTSTVANIDRMLRRILGEDIDYSTSLADDLWNTIADPSAIEQVIVNLAVNARDAMPLGGKLTIETRNSTLDSEYTASRNTAIPAGEYVLLAVVDNGEGMDSETQSRIFEPFFTTKEESRGTGLGLSTCYGIVKQVGGFIWVYSEKGKGTTFKVYLPKTIEETAKKLAPPRAVSLQGSETILVTEDDNQVRALSVRALRRYGYTVLEAETGDDALLICEQQKEHIDLLLTDLIMPRMGGKELAERVVSFEPEMKVLFMSGYTENAIVHHGVLRPGIALLQKPFTPESLARKVREILDSETPDVSPT